MYHYQINGAIISTAQEWPGHTAMTDAEYETAMQEVAAKTAIIDRYVAGEIELADVPQAYRDEAAVAKGLSDNPPLSDSEALNIITGQENE